jgi:hypothetical protein
MSTQTSAVHAHGHVHAHGFKSTKTLMEIELPRVMRQHPDAVREANAVYHVTIAPVGKWTVDTTVPNGRVSVGLRGHSDCDFDLSEETLHHLMDRSASPQQAYMHGELHVSNPTAALRLAQIISQLSLRSR